MSRPPWLIPLAIVVSLFAGLPVLLNLRAQHNDMTRNMDLKSFDPHRQHFACRHEADAVPPIDAQAEQWFQQGLAVTSFDLPEARRDYAQALTLWSQAAERHHWKAMLNLATLYVDGQGTPRDTERAVQAVEQAMRLGIPAAYDLMGTYHMNGTGVKQDASRAYGFWQLAADKGSPSAMGYLGARLLGGYDNPGQSMWSNQSIGVQMLECGVAQGNGTAAYELGTWLSNIGINGKSDHPRGLRLLHEAVKFGSEDAAIYLSASFNLGDALVNGAPDTSRGKRYGLLSDALRYNHDLRFPNLDKVLPMPQASLPKWDGNEQTLIDAAKGRVATPGPPSDRGD